MSWRTQFTEILRSGSYSTQGELARALADQGFKVDQAAISRELKAQGVVKVEGIYQLPASGTDHAVLRFTATAGECLVVVVTEPAYAMALAQEIDHAELEGVLGTVAGDDTVFVATSGPAGTEKLASWLGVSRR